MNEQVRFTCVYETQGWLVPILKPYTSFAEAYRVIQDLKRREPEVNWLIERVVLNADRSVANSDRHVVIAQSKGIQAPGLEWLRGLVADETA